MKNSMLLAALAALSFVLASCSKFEPEKSNLISPRYKPGTESGSEPASGGVNFLGETPKFVALLKLHEPPLLTVLTADEDGNMIIDKERKEALLEEQEKFKKKLMKISPDISILYTYKMVLNAMAIVAPQEVADEISELDFAESEPEERFALPQVFASDASVSAADLRKHNTMDFIGANKIHKELKLVDSDGNEQPVLGQKIKVGIIDTGIDYTHSMLGGSGDSDIYETLDKEAANAHFPNKKVVGGYDFVGTKFNTSSNYFRDQIPSPDINPLDEGGHGTHVSGSVAGIGDGKETFSGAAPGAELYALKVFGANGSTSDTAVIAALEYAADPNGDFNLEDKLDVVNLSLGGGYGMPHNLYSQAIENLVKGGTVTVASAGNSGDQTNIVGAPGTADDAISVAASIDDMKHNWEFPAIKFEKPDGSTTLTKAVQGAINKKIIDAGNVVGKLVYIGDATKDLTPEQLKSLEGHVAMIDRGKVSFAAKMERAKNGKAIGVVMVNNIEGSPIVMGGEGFFHFPGVMISKELGDALKAEMEKGEVTIDFLVSDLIEEPEVIDSLTGFSSRGPRTLDSKIKPEITSPGQNIISAKMGGGNKGVQFSGTSMSAPVLTGVVALLKQYRSDLTPYQIKSLIMNTAKVIKDKDGNVYPISRQGAGRVRAYEAAVASLTSSESSLSLGEVQVDEHKSLRKKLVFKNTSDEAKSYSVSGSGNDNLTVKVSESSLQLDAGESVTVMVDVAINDFTEETAELDGWVKISEIGGPDYQIPILAVVNTLSVLSISELVVHSTNLDDSSGSAVDLTIENKGSNPGSALIFNLLAKDDRKPAHQDTSRSLACDLESVGYRTVERDGEKYFQIGVKIYNPVTSWRVCSEVVELDFDGDGVADQEIAGVEVSRVPGLGRFAGFGFGSILFDSKKLREIREKNSKDSEKDPENAPPLDYFPAVAGLEKMRTFDHSTINVLEAKLSALAPTVSGEVALRVMVTYDGGNVVEEDDLLSGGKKTWYKLNLKPTANGYNNIPDTAEIAAGESVSVPLIKGDRSDQQLLLLYPRNRFTLVNTGQDGQSQIGVPSYLAAPLTQP